MTVPVRQADSINHLGLAVRSWPTSALFAPTFRLSAYPCGRHSHQIILTYMNPSSASKHETSNTPVRVCPSSRVRPTRSSPDESPMLYSRLKTSSFCQSDAEIHQAILLTPLEIATTAIDSRGTMNSLFSRMNKRRSFLRFDRDYRMPIPEWLAETWAGGSKTYTAAFSHRNLRPPTDSVIWKE